jgi:hypothetical protein
MKNRTGFVSNSSSCSFVVYKKDLTTEEQISLVENFEETYKRECERRNSLRDEDNEPEYYFNYPEDIKDWKMNEESDRYCFSTYMDNADLVNIFESVGITVSDIGDGYTW